MKTSNVLLILLFVISISLISAIPIVVNLKLNNRDFVTDRESSRYELHEFGAARFISLKGLANCILVPSDSLKLEVEASQSNAISTDRRGDTLIIRSDQSNNHAVLYAPNFKLYLPLVERIACYDSNIELNGSVIPKGARSYRIDLYNSKLVIKGRDAGLAPYRQFFDQLFVTGANDSGVDLSSLVTIQNLNLVNINNTVIDGYSVAIDEINTTFDPKARVKMRSVHGAIKINAIP